MGNENITPMMRQYLDIKGKYQDAILFFRLGDFYEMFFEDAVKASEILDITLTSRNKNEESSVPLCGVPYHSAGNYIRKLIEEGYKVAICDQVEDPKQAKGIVKREVTRVITPGLLVEEESLSTGEPNYLAGFLKEENEYHLGMVDISTGEIWVGPYDHEDAALQEIIKHRVREIILFPLQNEDPLVGRLKAQTSKILFSPLEGEAREFSPDPKIFSPEFLASLRHLPSLRSRELILALVTYIQKTQKSTLKHLGPVQMLHRRQHMRIDERTFRHLELTRNVRGEGRRGTLFWVLDKTMTGMGARRLIKWIHYPLLDLGQIEARLDAVQELLEKPELTFSVQEELKRVRDIERMLGKVALATVNARDLLGLGKSLKTAEELFRKIRPQVECALLQRRLHDVPNLQALSESLIKKIAAEPPLTVREGGIIAEGVHSELDELRGISRDGKGTIAAMEEEERTRTGISSLKIRYNKVFGYYLEVTHTHRENVPSDYIRKQTLTNAERYITPRLKEYENKVLGAEERIKALEYEIFCQVRQECADHLEAIRQVSETLGDLDVLASLAKVARENRYSRPVITEESILELRESRHPVLECLHGSDQFIPNDIIMEEKENRLFLITGPNMAGKSTVMRQAALAILMAQLGSFVPAGEAKIGLVDQIFTRIGASDDLFQGQSTFMVEMLETAHILKSATPSSFIILDEIGRGTSTYDGMSIAWAVAEFVAKEIGCRALFATHYHELIELSQNTPGMENYQVAVKEWNDQILFLRKLIQGGASRSYGIEVARLAGLPPAVLDRAKEVLRQLEKLESGALQNIGALPNSSPPQMELFSQPHQRVLDELKKIQPDILSPLEAVTFLYKIKKMLENEEQK